MGCSIKASGGNICVVTQSHAFHIVSHSSIEGTGAAAYSLTLRGNA